MWMPQKGFLIPFFMNLLKYPQTAGEGMDHIMPRLPWLLPDAVLCSWVSFLTQHIEVSYLAHEVAENEHKTFSTDHHS